MIGNGYAFVFEGYRESSIRQDFHRVSGFQVTLADARLAGELPNAE